MAPLLALAACGGEGAAEATSSVAPAQAAEPVTEAIFASAPIRAGLGPFAGDDEAVWFTDFDAVARYDVATASWSSFDLPAERDIVDGVAFAAHGDGTAAVLIEVCDGPCHDESQIQLRAHHAGPDGLTEIPGPDLVTTGDVRAVGATGDGAHFQIHGASGNTQLVTVTAERATLTDLGRDLFPVCVTAGGATLGLELAATGDDKTVTVFAGPSPDELEPVGVPSGAAEVLAGVEVSSSAVCTEEVLAVVGPDGGWEFDATGAVSEVPSAVTVPPGRGQRQISPAATAGGVTWVAATGVNLRRDADGWRAAEERPGDMTAARDTGYATVGGALLSYPPGDEPAGVPAVEGNEGG